MVDQSENLPQTKPHSRLGIASIIIGGTLPLLLILLFVAGAAFEIYKISIGNYLLIAFAVLGMAGPLIHLVGFGLGLGGLISKKTKNFLPITGAILNFMLGISGVLIIVFTISNLKFPFH